jgi:hypothetical protein
VRETLEGPSAPGFVGSLEETTPRVDGHLDRPRTRDVLRPRSGICPRRHFTLPPADFLPPPSPLPPRRPLQAPAPASPPARAPYCPSPLSCRSPTGPGPYLPAPESPFTFQFCSPTPLSGPRGSPFFPPGSASSGNADNLTASSSSRVPFHLGVIQAPSSEPLGPQVIAGRLYETGSSVSTSASGGIACAAVHSSANSSSPSIPTPSIVFVDHPIIVQTTPLPADASSYALPSFPLCNAC